MFFTTSAWAYTPPIGIPDPDWGTTHPIDTAAPVTATRCPDWPAAATTDCYYIDVDHASSTDTANTYGYPNKPRKTIPEITYAAGAYVEIHNGPYSGGGQIITLCPGTDAKPCWVVGIGSPEITGSWIFKGSYTIIDGLYFSTTLKGVLFRPALSSNLHHACIRNSIFAGPGVNSGNAAAIAMYGENSTNRFTDLVAYGNTIHDFGDDTALTENDYHGIAPSTNVDRVWILGNTIYNMGGDSIQVGTASTADENRVDTIYIGGNTFHDDRENAVDIKEADNVIVSQNEMYGYAPSSSSQGGIALIAHNTATNIWVLFNKIHDSGSGVSSTSSTGFYVVGNLFYDIHNTAGFDNTDSYQSDGRAISYYSTTNAYVVDNTIYDTDFGIQARANISTHKIHGNIITNRAEFTGYDLWLADAEENVDVNYSLFYRSDNIRINWGGTTYTSVAAYQAGATECANCVEGDPLLVLPPGDLKISDGSPALNASVEGPTGGTVYDLFNSTYSVAIEVDYAKTNRPINAWDIGAYESLESPDTVDPSLTILTANAVISSDTLSVSWSDGDNVGVTGRKWRIGAAPDGSNGTAATSPATVTGFALGMNMLYVGATDAAGNWGSDSITVEYAPNSTKQTITYSATGRAATYSATGIQLTN